MDYHGIPLCNRDHRLTALSLSLSLFITASFRQSLVISFLSRASFSEADLISSTLNVAYNFPRVGEKSILAGIPSLYLLIQRLT